MDWARVEELQNDLGVEDFEEITTLFLEEVEDRLAALMAGKLDDLASDLHFLRGSAANLGFSGFKDACVALEQSPDTCDIDALQDAYVLNKNQFLAGVETRLAS